MSVGSASLAVRVLTRVAMLIIILLAVWGAFALWYQVPGGQLVTGLSLFLWGLLVVAVLVMIWRGWTMPGLLGFAIAFGAVALWWQRIEPSNDRVWADDVSRLVTGTVQGNQVTLRNVRNFDWRSDTDFNSRWETRTYDLDRLRSVDLILSYWSMRAIAHVLVSFGFDDGSHIAFSVEIRREKGESFSEIGGFFKEFELIVIAADERDVVRVRTNVRGEDDYLYRVQLSPAMARSLFLAYLDEANGLADKPRFYNTVTVNCTTLVYGMMKHIVGYLPWDYRVLFSGYLPEYVYKVGGLDKRYTLDRLTALGRITERARQADRSESFSADIRRGVPR